jgi:hypothetical protein
LDGALEPYSDGNERVDFLSSNSKCLHDWVVFDIIFSLDGGGKSILAIGEFLNCITIVGAGGGKGTPSTHRMFGLSLARQVHEEVVHVIWKPV